MSSLTFAFIREGASDDGLVAHIRTLLLREGVEAAIGASRPYKGSVQHCLEQVWAEPDEVDLVFVHRDSDAAVSTPTHALVDAAARAKPEWTGRVVAVVPVQELEAWLLTEEREIRTVVGKPGGRQALGLPKVAAIEQTASPKELLQKACLTASGATGARYKREKKAFSSRRATLLNRLDLDGPVNELTAWRRFRADLGNAVADHVKRQASVQPKR